MDRNSAADIEVDVDGYCEGDIDVDVMQMLLLLSMYPGYLISLTF